MSLSLKIENVDQLPDGGPVSITIDQKGLDIGRDPFMDWTLPDPQRFISGTHCHVRYQDGGYWLHDVSTNGTMINGSPNRLSQPHQLQDGDRIHIGGYIVAVTLAGGAPASADPGTASGGADPADPWSVQGAAPPVDQRQFRRDSGGAAARPTAASFPDENVGFDAGFAGTPGSGSSGSPDLDFGGSAKSGPAAAPGGAPVANQAEPAAAPPADWRTGAPAPSDSPPTTAPEPTDQAADWRQAVGGAVQTPPAGPPEAAPQRPPVVEPAPQSPPVGAFDAAPQTPPAEPSFDVTPSTRPAGALDAVPSATPPLAGEFGSALSPENVPDQAPVEATQPLFEADPAPKEPLPDWRAEAGVTGETEPEPEEEAPLQLVNPISVPNRPGPAQQVPAPAPGGTAGGFIAAFERGAGVPAGTVANRADEQFAEEIGQLFRLSAEGVTALLKARSETKTAMRSDDVTQFSRQDNNPLKFSPTVEQALKLMFGETPDGYLGARETMERSFTDLQKHQLFTFSAMQAALIEWMKDLDPETIAGDTSQDGGLAGLVNSRRAKLWDIYVERYRSKATHQQRGMIDAFMILFSSKYSEQARAADNPGQSSGGS